MTSEELLKKFGFEQEVAEEAKDIYLPTPFPQPLKRYRVVWEVYNMSMEESYYWILRYINQDWGFPHVLKTIDVFAAAENSAFFGVSQQRIGLQQDKVSQFLATIGKMVKELFQLVRELRIIDERLTYYEESFRGIESSEITLKGYWVDLVEGGAKNPASVFGMAREVQFTSLPDLFFSTHPRTSEEVDRVVDTQRAGFNKSVRNALKRKLKTFLVWKDRTNKEMRTRRIFTLKYLRQHYDIIKMYMTWVRPYLRHIRRLTLDEDKVLTPEMVSAFEGSMIEVEFLAHKLPVNDKNQVQNKVYHSCILAHFLYRTRPSMSYQQEGYQRGPIHVGKLEIDLRAYVWKKDKIDKYVEMKKQEDFELMKSISGSVKAAMTALGGELEKYLEEAGEEITAEEGAIKPEAKTSKPGFLKRFRAEFLGPSEEKKAKKPRVSGKDKIKLTAEKGFAEKIVKATMFYVFKNYKKGHRMVMW
ncbi:hypothetical protein KY331_05340 [Candidatus Woesearchaeota archaeon]|nr:hypothetical protein [Candidatus Woesearchaeota archaeon]